MCEFRLEPTGANLEKARRSLEDYIDIKCDYSSKIHALLYYYHLKEAFQDVYGPDVKVIREDHAISSLLSEARRHLRTPELPPAEFDNEGDIVITEDGTWSIGPLGTNKDFESLIGRIQIMGNYPVLVGLLDVYMANCRQDPEPVIDECNRLLSDPRIGREQKPGVQTILRIAETAKNKNATIYFEFLMD